MKLSVTKKINAGFGLSLLLLLLVSIVSYNSIRKLVKNSVRETRTYETIASIEDVIVLITDIETGSRGYVITGDDDYLEPYNSASAVIDERIHVVAALIAESEEQHEMFHIIEPLIHAKRDFQADLINLRRYSGFEAAKQAMETDIGTYLMREIRVAARNIINNEYALLIERSGRVKENTQHAIFIIIISSTLAMSIVLFAIVIINRDIARRAEAEEMARRAKEEAESANRAKSIFLANMSHEIRTPLNAIAGMADLISETPLTEEQRRYVDISRRAGENLLGLINDVLDLSKVEAGKLELEETSFSLTATIEKVIEVLALKAGEKGLRLSYNINQDVQTTLSGDPNRLRQILFNLIGNSIKFTDKGGIVLNVKRETAEGMDQEKAFLLFSVRDTGIGIPPEKLDTIFENFSQAHLSTSRVYGGTGLGLAITKRLVEMMGGNIWVESRVGEGSSFYFTAVFGTPSAESNLHEQPLSQKEEAPVSPINILLVDDSEDNRTLIESYLRKLPGKVETAENGVDALSKYMDGSYDLVLMDMQMPVMDGYAATREIRKWEAEIGKEPAPIIALTAYAFKEDMEKSLEAGCTAHLPKPVKKATLLETISRYHKKG